jgi:hypothetical protein
MAVSTTLCWPPQGQPTTLARREHLVPDQGGGLARLAGFEPAAGCLEGSCSVQLSYRRPELIVHDGSHALDMVRAKSAVAMSSAVGRPAAVTGRCLSSCP